MVPLAGRGSSDRQFWSLVEAHFAENGTWKRLRNRAATLMAIEPRLSNLPEKRLLRPSFPNWHRIAARIINISMACIISVTPGSW